MDKPVQVRRLNGELVYYASVLDAINDDCLNIEKISFSVGDERVILTRGAGGQFVYDEMHNRIINVRPYESRR